MDQQQLNQLIEEKSAEIRNKRSSTKNGGRYFQPSFPREDGGRVQSWTFEDIISYLEGSTDSLP